jgi:hypothetical protein
MQQKAIPFEQSPRSFALTVFIMMIMVSVTQLFGTHALPSLRKLFFWWVERGEIEEVYKRDKELRDVARSVEGLAQDIIITDEERATRKTLKDKTRTLTTSGRVEL